MTLEFWWLSCCCRFWSEYAIAIVEVGNDFAILVEVLHFPGGMAVVNVLAELQPIREADIEIGAAVHPFDCSDVAVYLNHHADAGKLDPAVLDHICDKTLCLALFTFCHGVLRGC